MPNDRTPTVSQIVGKDSSVLISRPVPLPANEGVRPDFDTDVLWKPVRLGPRQRTVSIDSTESAGNRRISVSDAAQPLSPTMDIPEGRTRRLSISEMIFGSPKGGFSWGQSGLQNNPINGDGKSVTDDVRFKELLKHQSKILNDEGTFKMSDFMKS